jgi:hypothetical protein
MPTGKPAKPAIVTCDHQSMARVRLVVVPVLVSAALLASACGSGSHRASSTRTAVTHAPASGARLPKLSTIPTPAPTGVAASAAAVHVITSWANALRTGNVHAAAGLFRDPSEFVNGPDAGGGFSVIVIHSLPQAVTANEALPCGARFVSADQRGKYVNALFRLTGRSGPGRSTCGGGVGETARTNFLIQDGQIVEWIRAPDDPGDNGSSPTTPGASTGPVA